MTQQDYCEKMRGMFMSGGWTQCYKPGIQRLRETQLEIICIAPTWEETLAARHALQMLDSLLCIEDQVEELEKQLAAQPDEAGNVVELPVVNNQP